MPSQYAAGDIVVIGGMCGGDGPNGQSLANGIRKVGSIIDATHFTITDLDGTALNPTSSVFCDPIGGTPGAQWTGKLTAYTLGAQPLGWLDGMNGTFYRRLALGTANGLVTLTVDSNHMGHLQTSYPHGINSGDHFAVWNSGNAALDNGNAGAAACTYGKVSGDCPTIYAYTAQNITPHTLDFAVDSFVPAGTYSSVNKHCGPAPQPNGTIGGTDDCLRVSQIAWTGNPLWDSMVTESNYYYTGSDYMVLIDGGKVYPGVNDGWFWSMFALRFMVDQNNAAAANIVNYAFNNIEKMAGVNWDHNSDWGTSSAFAEWGHIAMQGLGWLYVAWGPYVNPANKAAFLNKIYNDLDDPTVPACSTAHGNLAHDSHNEVLAAGVARGGDNTSITLSLSDSRADGYYFNNVIRAMVGGRPSYGLVTTYTESTKVAQVASWSAGTPTIGTAYTIFATISISSSALGSSATVTGYNTTFRSHLSVNDAVLGINTMADEYYEAHLSGVSAIVDDTHLQVTNSTSVTATATPSVVWYLPKWLPGDCGFSYVKKTWLGTPGSQPLTYPSMGGAALSQYGNPVQPNTEGGNQLVDVGLGHVTLDMATAPDEPRAVRDLAIGQSYVFDYAMRHYLNYLTGFAHSGSAYSIGVNGGLQEYATVLAMSLPTYPSQDLAGPWVYNYPLWMIYSTYPDFRDGAAWPLRWGAEDAANMTSVGMNYIMRNAAFTWSPGSAISEYLRNWISNRNITPDPWGFYGERINYFYPSIITQNDPNKLTGSDYTVLPHQYLFQAASTVTCVTLTGWPCPPAFRGDAVISRTGFRSKSDTQLYFGARAWLNDHDIPENGTVKIYKAGELLNSDSIPTGAETSQDDNTEIGDMIQIGGSRETLARGLYANQPGESPIVQWAGAGHGPYGSDQYMFACADLRGAYTVGFQYAFRCIAHLKDASINSGTGQEIIVQWDSVKTAAPVAGGILTHIHYPQTGETNASAYPEGSTIYDQGQVISAEDGGIGINGNPNRNYAIVTSFLSPGAITVRDDGTSYPRGLGHTRRFSICAGSSCGSSVQIFESMIVHRITTLSDETLTVTPINPDANWTGFQSADKVVLMNRGGTAHGSISSFTTTHRNTAQYLVAGLRPGTYTVTVNGTPVPESPFTVAPNDNTIEFTSTAGTVHVSNTPNRPIVPRRK